MSQSVEVITTRKISTLISLFLLTVLINLRLAEGVHLCKNKSKAQRNSYDEEDFSADALSDEFPNIRHDDDNNDEYYRKESSEDRLLRAMLMNEREAYRNNYRAESAQGDYSDLEGSLGADMLRNEAPVADRRKEDLQLQEYLSNRYIRNEDDDNGWMRRQRRRNNYAGSEGNYYAGGYDDGSFK